MPCICDSVALDWPRAIAGNQISQTGRFFIYRDGGWRPDGKAARPRQTNEGGYDGQFGSSATMLGNYAALGGTWRTDGQCGAAIAYRRSSNTWRKIAIIIAPGLAHHKCYFKGFAVALTRDELFAGEPYLHHHEGGLGEVALTN